MEVARATRLLVFLYPALEGLPPVKRRDALVTAKRSTFRRWYVWLPLLVSVVSFVAYAAVNPLRGTAAGRTLEWLGMVLIWVSLIAGQIGTRMALRRIINAGQSRSTA